MAAQEAEEDEEDNQLVGLLIINLFRGYVRSSAPVEFETTSRDIYESTLNEIRAVDFTEQFDDPSGAPLQDGLVVLCRLMLYQEATSEEEEQAQQRAILSRLETYGLSRDAALGFLAECQTFFDAFESNVDVEETLESRVGSMIDDASEDGMVRTSLVQVQDDLFLEVLNGFSEVGDRLADDSEWVLEFVEAAGKELERAENPVFAALWYSISAQLLGLFTTDGEVLSRLQNRFETCREEREQYEQQLENPLIAADELGEEEVEMPDLLSEIATTNSQQSLPEPGGEADVESGSEDKKSDRL